MKDEPGYVPGVCNIGKTEIRARKMMGWAAVLVVLAWWGYCVVNQSPLHWRLVSFFPATMAAVAFLQSAFHFCVMFGWSGMFNFGTQLGQTDTVEQAEFRQKDRKRALQILALAILIGLAVAWVTYTFPR